MILRNILFSLLFSWSLLWGSGSGIDFNDDGIDDFLVRDVSTGKVWSWIMASDGRRSTYRYVASIPSENWTITGMGDFNGDGTTDILVRNRINGQIYVWLMKRDGKRDRYRYITTLSTDWEIEGTDNDFNGDGIDDIVVRDGKRGWTYIWLMDGDGSRKSYRYVTTIPREDWEIVGTSSDFNQDGIDDIVVRNLSHGWVYVWLMNGDGSRKSYRYITTLPRQDWEIAGTSGDFNKDGIDDIVVRNLSHGWVYVWLMNGDGSRKSYRYITTLPSDAWEIVETDNEFNGDGISDLTVRNRETGSLYLWIMNEDGTRNRYRYVTKIPATAWEIVETACDFDRNGIDDFVVRRSSDGATFSWLMSENGTRKNVAPIATIPFDRFEIAHASQPRLFPNLGVVLHPALIMDEKRKIDLIRDDARPFRYLFSFKPLQLYVSNAPGKPCKHPSEPTNACDLVIDDPDAVFVPREPVYTNGYRSAFVEKGKDEHLWFAYSTLTDKAERVVWQLADRPFTTDEKAWNDPPGLLASGIVSVGNGEFEIDFSALGTGRSRFSTFRPDILDKLDLSPRLFPWQKKYYVRALAIDENGEVVGTPERGMEILYGYPYSVEPYGFIHFPFDLKTLSDTPLIRSVGDHLVDQNEVYFSQTDDTWKFLPENFPKTVETIYLQVTTVQPHGGANAWRNPPGLIEEIELEKGMEAFENLAKRNLEGAISIDLTPLHNSSSDVFFVRAVSLSPSSSEAGVVVVNYSKTVKMIKAESVQSEITLYFPTKIDAHLPKMRVKEYVPIQWEQPDWMYIYQVTRQPTWRELTNGFIPSDTLVKEMKVGTIIKFEKPGEHTESWYEKAWNAVKKFFENIESFLKDIVNWVANTYNDLKQDLVAFVANHLPLVPDSLRDELRQALEYLVDYGLSTIGLPPELPNFDELASMGAEYLAAQALETAGVPSTLVDPSDVVRTTEELGKEIDRSMTSHASHSPNPLHWNFVRLYPGALYRPAYATIEFYNPYDEPTPHGVLRSRVHKTLTQKEISQNLALQSMIAGFDNNVYYDLYRPVDGIEIPSLQPHQRLVVPIIFKEYTGEAYPFWPKPVSRNDFRILYWLDDFTFEFSVDYLLPPAEQYAKEHGIPFNEGGYEYEASGETISLKLAPFRRYRP
ncbi:FG-GAP repeat domain-containing protein [Hydrogenimonas sp.]